MERWPWYGQLSTISIESFCISWKKSVPTCFLDGASDLRAIFERWAYSLEHSVGVLHIPTQWLHTEDSLNIFPAGPVNGGLQRLKVPCVIDTSPAQAAASVHSFIPSCQISKQNFIQQTQLSHSIKVSECSQGELHRKYQDLPLSTEQRAKIRQRTCR